ncbi:MAG: hypothetical protein ACYSX1_06535 [Planctomycetota bacterium]|jgi:hypothetical protein
MDTHGKLVEKLRWRIAHLLALRQSLRSLTVCGFLLGIIILIVRVVFVVPRTILLWTLVSPLPVVLLAIALAIRKMPSQEALCALLDRQNQCGGLLMASEQVDLGSWQDRIPPLNSPVLRWRGARSLLLFAAAVAFILVSFGVPQRYVDITLARPLDISREMEEIQQQIETLQEEEVVSEQRAQQLEQELDQLRDTSSGYDPVKTWEALDHIQQSLNKEADQAAASCLRQTEGLTRAETLAQGLCDNAAELNADLLSEAMSELSATIDSLASENESLANNLGSDCLNACQQNSLRTDQLEELLAALRSSKADASDSLKELCNAGLIDPKNLESCKNSGACNAEGLAAFLNENASSMGMGEALSAYCQGQGKCPGRGGINRGRGDAPMTWTDGSGEEGVAFKEQVLPAASLEALKESKLVGVRLGAHSTEDSSADAGTGTLNAAAVGGGEAFRHVILPRHKGVVRRYFERE